MSTSGVRLDVNEEEIASVDSGSRFFISEDAEAHMMKELGEDYYDLTFTEGGIDIEQARKIVAFEKGYACSIA